MALNRKDLAQAEEVFSSMLEKLRFVINAKVSGIDLTPEQLVTLRADYNALKIQLAALLP